MNENSKLEERLQKMEANMAHLEHLYDQLNKIVVEQSDIIRRMQHNHQRLATTLEGMELDRIRNTNSKPPHYHQ